MCVLLQALLDKNLIPQETCEIAKTSVRSTLDGPTFFYRENEGKEKECGHT